MEYKLKVSKIHGDVVPLWSVVEAMAEAKATAFGTCSFHRPTYEGLEPIIAGSLHEAAMNGSLSVCNHAGFQKTASEIIAEAKIDGSFSEVRQYLTKPDWKALFAKYPERHEGLQFWNFVGIDLGKTKTDTVSSELLCLYATLKSLNDWGAKAGNSFSLDPDAPPWIDERGLMGLSETTPSANKDGSQQQERKRGLGRKEILAVDWPLPNSFPQESFSKALSDVPAWLTPARILKGAPGKGSSLWNPALLAACLHERHKLPLRALDNFILRNFSDWQDEWEQKSQYLR